jgi:hypothetical protein
MRGYHRERLRSERYFDPESFRTKTAGDHRVIIGCRRGSYDSRTGRCQRSTEVYEILHPKFEKNPGGCTFKKTLKTAGAFFEGAIERVKKIRLPRFGKHIIEVGAIFNLEYYLNAAGGKKALAHNFNGLAKVYSAPGANWALIIGNLKFTSDGFVNKK